jgi:hypothetical protein
VPARAKALCLPLVALMAGGCGGGGDERLGAAGLRECLAGAGLRVEGAAPAVNPTLGSARPDFRAFLGDLPVNLIVERNEVRARRRAADVRGSLATFGVADADRRVLQERNVTAVFEGDPTSDERKVVASCLD